MLGAIVSGIGAALPGLGDAVGGLGGAGMFGGGKVDTASASTSQTFTSGELNINSKPNLIMIIAIVALAALLLIGGKNGKSRKRRS